MANSTSLFNDVVLTDIFRGYNPPEYTFIHDDVLPTIPVKTTTGQIPNTGTGSQDWLRVLSSDLITEASGTPKIETTITKGTGWQTERHGAQHQITRNDGQRWSQSDWKAGMRKAREYYTMLLKTNRMIAKEYALASILFNASTFSSYSVTLTGADQFDNQSSDPLGVAKDARRSIEHYAHQEPNTCIMPWPIFQHLVGHKQLKETHGVGPSGTVPVLDLNISQLKQALNVERILIPNAKYETAVKGATSSLARIWGNYMMFLYVNPSPQPMEFQRSLGYTFELTPGSMDWYEVVDPRDTQYVRYEEEYDQLILDLGAAYLIVNPVSTAGFTVS